MSRHDVIDFDILWTILSQDFPKLIEALAVIVASET